MLHGLMAEFIDFFVDRNLAFSCSGTLDMHTYFTFWPKCMTLLAFMNCQERARNYT